MGTVGNHSQIAIYRLLSLDRAVENDFNKEKNKEVQETVLMIRGSKELNKTSTIIREKYQRVMRNLNIEFPNMESFNLEVETSRERRAMVPGTIRIEKPSKTNEELGRSMKKII